MAQRRIDHTTIAPCWLLSEMLIDNDEARRDAKAREMFKRIDADGNGCLSVEELENILYEEKLPTSRSQVKALHRAMDTKQDGGVDLDEFLTFIAKRRRALRAAFDSICSDGGADPSAEAFTAGHLRKAAQRADVALSDRDVREIMERIDRDKDGSVTFDEFVNCIMLVPFVNPHAFFDRWFVDAFADDSEFSFAREVRPKDGEGFYAMVVQKIACGGAAGVISRTLTAPVDRIRVILMTAEPRIGIAAAYNRAVSHLAGIRALWIGNGVNCVKIAPEMGIKLFAFDAFKTAVAADPDNVSTGERIVAGGCAGALAEFSVYPLDVLRTRLATGAYQGFQDCARSVWQSGGVGAFYAGLVPSIAGIIPYAAVDLTVNSVLRDLAAERLQKEGREVSVPLLLGCGMTSSLTAALLTFPIMVIRTQAQATAMPLGQIVRSLSAEGFSGFYRGIIPSLMKVMPATAISYASYEWFNAQWSSHVK